MHRCIRWIQSWGLIAVLFAGLSEVAAAAELLRVVFEDYPPYEYQESGQAKGVNVAIVRAVCARLDFEPRFESKPWKRALHEVRHGRADAIMSLFRTAEREQFLFFPEHGLSVEKNIVLTSRQRQIVVREWQDLRGLSVGVVAGNSYAARFDDADWINKIPATGSEQLLRKQASARTDVSVSNEWVARYLMRELKLDDQLVLLDFVVSEEPLFIAFSKAKGELSAQRANQFSTVLRQLQDDGVIARLIQEHGLEEVVLERP